MKCAFLAILLAASACAQDAGVQPVWEVRTALDDLSTQTGRMEPLLEQLNPADWTNKEAPEAYVAQWNSLRNEVGYVRRAIAELKDNPENLAKSVEVFLRLLSVEEMMNSFLDGVRRYHNPAVAELLTGIMNDSANSRFGFRNHLLELANLRETELRITNQELQRCRAAMLQRPNARGR